nr:MAG TPA: hypothetical protein [Caudoviricetes sp.]
MPNTRQIDKRIASDGVRILFSYPVTVFPFMPIRAPNCAWVKLLCFRTALIRSCSSNMIHLSILDYRK